MMDFPCCEKDEQYDAMVQCGRCEKWHHFSCVGVEQSVAELAWFCGTCLGEDVSIRESLGQPGISRTQPPRAAKKTSNSKKKAGKPLEQVSQKSGSVKSKGSKRDMALKQIEELKEKSRLEALEEENQLQILQLKQKQIERQQRELEELHQLSRIAEESDDEEEEHGDEADCGAKVQNWMNFYKQVHPALSQRSEETGSESNFSMNLTNIGENKKERGVRPHKKSSSMVKPTVKDLTKQQIASRQVFSKALPSYSGNPQDWPIFISAYEQANLSCGFTNAENLVRLQEALRGKALEIVKNRLLLPENVPIIINKLRRHFGNPEVLSTMLAQRIQMLAGPDSENLESVIEFGSAVEEFTQHLVVSKLTDHLKNPILMHSLIQKLPSCYTMQWVEYKRRCKVIDLRTFGKFMEDLVDKALEATFDRMDVVSSEKRGKSKSKAFVYSTEEGGASCNCKSEQQNGTTSVETSENILRRNSSTPQIQSSLKMDIKCSICQKLGHFGRECQEFQNMSLLNRWKIVRRMQLCSLCIYNHGQWPCRSKIRCDVGNCKGQHHSLLHPGISERTLEVEERCNSHRLPNGTVLFRIIPVTLYNKKNHVNTLALVDEGSSTSLIDDDLAEILMVDGPRESLKMCWTNGVSHTETHSKRVNMKISGRNQSKIFDLCNARTVNKLKLPTQQLDSKQFTEGFQHLAGIAIPSYELGTPKLLIGIDNIHLLAPLESRVGRTGEPIAVRCNLGWTVYGPRPNVLSSVHFLGHHRCACMECSKSDLELHQMMRDNFQIEAVGVSPVQLESKEDRRAREILEATTKRVGNRFETGLLWKDGEPRFPESYTMAYKRLKNLEVRMNRIPGIWETMRNQIDEYLKKGYAHKITKRELLDTPGERSWYLPLNFVLNPKKPGKIRMVWDAAAKANGVSFNDKLLKGPDFVTSLSGVIDGFRERKVGFGGDIREMFHQISVRSEDRQAQRFLFRTDTKRDPDIYVMDVVIFGASCSPCLAQFVKNLNAQEHSKKHPVAASAIIRKHYVDDYFDSADTEEEAVVRAKDVRKIHADAGFEIRNWLSNSSKVLEELGEAETKLAKYLDTKNCGTERVLGVMWQPDDDSFVFSTEVREDLRPYVQEAAWPTKRIALRCVMSMFDPKQFLAPVLIHGRVLMQSLWRSGIGLDEKIREVDYERWLQWTELFPLINNVRIPRCYLGEMSSEAYKTVQLHVFTDAGEDSYGCVAYFRFANDKNVHVAFVEAKAKVAPLQYLSIPRKELEAAVLGARLMKTICENHSFVIVKRLLWTDSHTVVSWVKSDVRRYKPFVAHRIGEILSVSSPIDWRWVPTRSNAADDVTKWGKATHISSNSRWFSGPDFLYQPEESWPKQNQQTIEMREELRVSILLHDIVLPDAVIPRVEHISKWKVLVRMVATMYRFLSNCRRRISKQPIEALPISNKDFEINSAALVPLRQEEYMAAENCLWRMVQGEEFPDEVKTLINNQNSVDQRRIEKSSVLYRLSPFLDEYGVVRMEGRTVAAEYAAFDVRFPIILSKKHLIVKKLVEFYHQQCGHSSREMVVNELRQRFYIPDLRCLVEKITRDCLWCKVQKAKPFVPRMAPLPRSRMAVRTRPFSYVGLDYFGPLEVAMGRRREKRWVALFTCMTIRAIHLEVVHSLSAQSCEMAIRRFVNRRGSPIEIFSDNGTNFVGASRDLEQQLKNINYKCADTFTGSKTKWTFNPPSAPHMGGVWERMVRSVKQAMTIFMSKGKLTDEILQTTLVEAEHLINSRPLTYVSTNVVEDREALTPNHFLRSCDIVECLPERRPIELAERLRSNYSQAQYLADELWNRWQREYLPTMNRRTKWFEDRKPVAVGDLVYVADAEKRNKWERGIVEEVIKGGDGRVRSAIVRTFTGLKKRPIAKLAVMEIGD